MGTYMSPPPGLEAPEKQGGALAGILGALLGALIGAIPWFIASTFAGFFVGWLGFLVGYTACLGYRKLGGRRSTGFAMVVIILSCVVALVLADLASNMYVLCTDRSWQRSAAHYGIPVAQLAFESLLMPENWPLILPNLLMGMLIGLLGVFSARRTVLEYTDPEKAAKLAAAPAFQRAGVPASTGKPLPRTFAVSSNKGVPVLGWLFLLFSGAFLALSCFAGKSGAELRDISALLVLLVICVAMGLWMLALGKRRIEVDGERLRYRAGFGGWQEFQAGDMGSLRLTQGTRTVLYSRDGQILAKFHGNMKNYPLLMQYFTEHNISLRG